MKTEQEKNNESNKLFEGVKKNMDNYYEQLKNPNLLIGMEFWMNKALEYYEKRDEEGFRKANGQYVTCVAFAIMGGFGDHFVGNKKVSEWPSSVEELLK
jgi:hypothetical protein